VDSQQLDRLLSTVDAGPPATDAQIALVEGALGGPLPQHYCEFLAHANGCEGVVGVSYVALWSVDQLAELNDAYSVNEFAPGLLLIGSDGDDTAYALDRRRDDAPVISVPFVGMSIAEVHQIGDDMVDLLAAVAAGEA
jgi:SMI1 / KNR4 family (SUKH-1)